MAEPSSSAAGAFAGHKAVLFGLPIAITLLAWWMGMRFVPLRRGRESPDMLNRLLACGVSSFAVGLPALVALLKFAPWAYSSAAELAGMAGLDAMIGFFGLAGCVLLLSSLPGPWLVAAFVLWFERRKGKDIAELVDDARGKKKG